MIRCVVKEKKGLKKAVEKHLKNIGKSLDEAAHSILSTMDSEIKRSINETSSGSRTNWAFGKGKGHAAYRYHAGGGRREFNASPPGQPPNRDMGGFGRSLRYEWDSQKKTGKVGSFGDNAIIGFYLEFGTEHMLPRPWLSPVVRKHKAELNRIFSASIKGGTK